MLYFTFICSIPVRKATTPPFHDVVTYSYDASGKLPYFGDFTGYNKGRRPVLFGRPALHV